VQGVIGAGEAKRGVRARRQQRLELDVVGAVAAGQNLLREEGAAAEDQSCHPVLHAFFVLPSHRALINEPACGKKVGHRLH
jgi:hypothetical protein